MSSKSGSTTKRSFVSKESDRKANASKVSNLSLIVIAFKCPQVNQIKAWGNRIFVLILKKGSTYQRPKLRVGRWRGI